MEKMTCKYLFIVAKLLTLESKSNASTLKDETAQTNNSPKSTPGKNEDDTDVTDVSADEEM
jgi:hypothetical protein